MKLYRVMVLEVGQSSPLTIEDVEEFNPGSDKFLMVHSSKQGGLWYFPWRNIRYVSVREVESCKK